MKTIETVLLTGKSRTVSPDGAVISGNHEGPLNIQLTAPGNSAARAHVFDAIQPHPTAEQLFAGAWSACYSAAVGIVAKEMKVKLPADTAVEIEVDLGTAGEEYLIQARLTFIAPGLSQELASRIAHTADTLCPYSKATRGNINVQVKTVTN